MDPDLRYLYAAPTGEAVPPVRTRPQLLPLSDLTWPNFERLCLRLVEKESEVDQVGLYGLPGQAQEGIDIYARRPDGDYWVYQCKRVREFTAGDLKAVTEDFLKGKWASRASRLVLCTSADLSETKLVEAVEDGNARMQAKGKALTTLDTGGLSRRLKTLPQLVLDFFDWGWLEEFCADAADGLRTRLGAEDAQQLRRQLATLYSNVFARQDAAVLLGLTSDAERQFVVQDVSERRELTFGPRAVSDSDNDGSEFLLPQEGRERDVEQRIGLETWLASSRAHVLTADAGSGKSSLLHRLAVDLLSGAPNLVGSIAGWRDRIPVWLPFGFWVRRIESNEACSLADALREWLSAYSEERCWPLLARALEDERLLLLVDGLDEWVDARAAGIAFDRLAVFVGQRNTPLLATTRPSALAELGPLPPGWHEASLAGLTVAQQRELLMPLGGKQTEAFLTAMARSPSLVRLAQTPLLLVLLFSLFRSKATLPKDRFKAYGESLDYLVREHPKRRWDTPAKVLDGPDITSALAALAFEMQRTGLATLDAREASARLATYLGDPTLGSDLNKRDARRLAREVVSDAEGRLGILVASGAEGVAFLHRSFQEHLAGVHLSNLPKSETQKLVAEYAPHAGWRDVLLNLLSLTNDAQNLELLDAMRQGRSELQRLVMQPLFAEIVACGLGPEGAVDQLAAEVVDAIETSPGGTIREQTLTRLLDAGDPGQREAASIETWLPSVLQDRPRVLTEMAGWPVDQRVDRTVWRSLFDEDTSVCRAAASAYIRLHKGSATACEQLLSLLDRPIEPQTRAAVLEAFAGEWPQQASLGSLMTSARRSSDANLRLVAHRWLIERNQQKREDLEDLLGLAEQLRDVDYERKPEVFELIRSGWPADSTVKRLALETARGAGGPNRMEPDGALWLLLEGYPKDPEVIDFCVHEIEGEKHPLLMLHFDGWKLLAKNFRDEPRLVAAIDRWLPKQEYREVEISFAARVGRTATGKRILIEGVSDRSFPHWFVWTLLEEWGMADPEVAAALTAAALGDARLAGLIAHQIPRIIEDRREATARVIELLADSENVRPELALMALGELGAVDREVLDTALERYVGTGRPDELWFWLIEHGSEDPRVRKLAEHYADRTWCTAAVVARAYAHDEQIRHDICRRMNPLPAQLRTRIAERIRDGCGTDHLAANVSALFINEDDPLASATLAQARVRRARGDDRQALTGSVAEGLKARGPTHEQMRQAALTAAIELGQIDLFVNAREDFSPENPVDIGLTDSLRPNIVLGASVAEHWNELREGVPNLLARMSKRESAAATWDVLARVADVSPDLVDAALQQLDKGDACSAALLRLHARARPGDPRLLERCLEVLRGEVKSSSLADDVTIAAVELLADACGGDEEVLGRVCGADLPLETLLLVLAEGWHESSQLREALVVARREGMIGHRERVFRVRIATQPGGDAVNELRGFIDFLAAAGRHVDRGVPAIVRRLRRDRAIVDEVERAIRPEAEPSEIASFSRLLALAKPLARTARRRLLDVAEEAVSGDLAMEVAYDLVAGRQRPLALSLFDSLGSA